jgi:small ligand-binding sensory domain FIST
VKAGGALVLGADAETAAGRAVAQARASLGDVDPSFAVLFASSHYFGSAETLVAAVAGQTGRIPLIGCVTEGVAGGAREVEAEAAVSLWLAAGLGPVETFAMEFVRTASGGAFGGYRFGPGPSGLHLMICDPFTFPAGDLLAHLNEHVPGPMVMGGMASGGLRRRETRLFLDGQVRSSGAVGAHLARAEVHPLVAQGCRPLGDPYTVTRADGHLILELGGRPPLTRLQQLATTLPDRDRELLAQGAHLGLVINEYQAELPGQGDFLVRGILGADSESGAIAVGEDVEVGQTVQFHVRDAHSADEDLRRILAQENTVLGGRPAAGALLFTCNGRGSRMFTEPDHDAGLLAALLGEIPVAGFFCAGELGPVGGQNFLHTFTASIALFPADALPGIPVLTEQPAQRDGKLLLPPQVVVATGPLLVPAGEPGALQPLGPVPGRPPETRLQHACRQVVPDPGRPGRAADPAGHGAGAQARHRPDQFRTPLRGTDGPGRAVGEPGRHPRPVHRAELLARPRHDLAGDEPQVSIEAAAVKPGHVFLGAPVGPVPAVAGRVMDANQQHGRGGAGRDGRLQGRGEVGRRFSVGQHAGGQWPSRARGPVDAHPPRGTQCGADQGVLADRPAQRLGR